MRIKKYLLILLSGLLVFASFPLATLAKAKGNSNTGVYSIKDEVIYGKLAANGKTKNLYVVNSFQMTKPGDIVDYGKYTNVRNLTDLTDIDQTGANEIHFQAEEEEFYYQGELENKPLPWDISITYLLDGEKMNPNELAGKSGNLEIQLTTSANETVDQVFFEYYLMQISLTFDPVIFHDLHAPKGTEANEGKNKLITFTVLPEQEEVFIVSAQVENLEMDPIDIAAMPASIAIEDPDVGSMTSDLRTLSDAIREINSGVAELRSGMAEFSDGATKLSKGSGEYQNGINELDKSSGELVDGSQQILSVLKQVSDAMQDGGPDIPDLGDLEALPQGFRDMAKELRDFAEALEELESAINQIENIDQKQIDKVYVALKDSGADDSVIDTVKQLEQTYETAVVIREITEEIPNHLATHLNNMADQLDLIADGLENAMEDLDLLDDLAELQDGLTTLSSEYETFHKGLISYTEGVNTLATSYQEIDQGTKELSDGALDLYDGASELHDGTKELHESTSDLPGQMQSEIDKFMEDFDYTDFEPTSFVSDQNENVGVVQFVLQTDKIEIEEPEEADEAEEEEKSLWERFLDLFR